MSKSKINYFSPKVYNCCSQIPKGKVSTYKYVAEFLDISPREVGEGEKIATKRKLLSEEGVFFDKQGYLLRKLRKEVIFNDFCFTKELKDKLESYNQNSENFIFCISDLEEQEEEGKFDILSAELRQKLGNIIVQNGGTRSNPRKHLVELNKTNSSKIIDIPQRRDTNDKNFEICSNNYLFFVLGKELGFGMDKKLELIRLEREEGNKKKQARQQELNQKRDNFIIEITTALNQEPQLINSDLNRLLADIQARQKDKKTAQEEAEKGYQGNKEEVENLKKEKASENPQEYSEEAKKRIEAKLKDNKIEENELNQENRQE
ncbi:11108_t:CDS:2 [Diversispora eburnea]|uniref:11108_t:CDS:1 n=1 Tax=Diversispora eburnea TaxID=1213867 RepID=A0A9N9FI90_9GLOM|nr:11108_t:CDS:2 [Diversispora eburnea]